MLYLKSPKTNGFVLIKGRGLETSYSLSTQNCTNDGKLLMNSCNPKAVVNLRFNQVLADRRHLQAYAASRDVTLFIYTVQRNTFREQKASGPAIREAISSSNCLGLLPTIIFLIPTFIIRVFRNDISLCSRCNQCEKLPLSSLFSTSPKILHVLWQGSCYLWQLMPFHCLLWLL